MTDTANDPQEGLERGDWLEYPAAPFPLLNAVERQTLLDLTLADPTTNEPLLATLQGRVTSWLAAAFPEMMARPVACEAVWHGEESLGSDALQLAKPLSLANAQPKSRTLVVGYHLDDEDPRVWSFSERFGELLLRFARKNPVPLFDRDEWFEPISRWQRLRHRVFGERTNYHQFMLELNRFFAQNDDFQDRATRVIHPFAPGSYWLFFADARSHAVLRGRRTLEFRFAIPFASLKHSEYTPWSLLNAYTVARRPFKSA